MSARYAVRVDGRAATARVELSRDERRVAERLLAALRHVGVEVDLRREADLAEVAS